MITREQWAAAAGPAYHHAYSIPYTNLPFSCPRGSLLLDVGCGWGRFLVPALMRGVDAVGLDLKFDSLTTARVLAALKGCHTDLVQADAGNLPFREGMFDFVFSNSVIQHIDYIHSLRAFAEISRVVKASGTSLIQLPNKSSLRGFADTLWSSIFKEEMGSQLRRVAFKEETHLVPGWHVRYWNLESLKRLLRTHFSEVSFSAKSFIFFETNLEHRRILPTAFFLLMLISDLLCRLSSRFRLLTYAANSIMVTARKSPLH